MPAPLTLDTSRPDWRRQARAQGTCKGPTCRAKILWVITEREGGKERWTPYNYDDGRIHHSTCPDVEAFKQPKREADATEKKVPQGGESVAPPVNVTPSPKPAPQQTGLFGPTGPTRYGVD